MGGFLYGQSANKLSTTLPLHENLVHGTLSNGITYYILENESPKDFVELRLAVNVGSVLEDEDQLGMAHFVEHMAFNGTENFEKNKLINFLESLGVSFGADLNAYTSFDETVYILSIPTNKEGYLEKGLLVLSDWASKMLFDSEEIEKERGVVLEEWRQSRGASSRYLQEMLPIYAQGSRYADRLPIGTKESIEGGATADAIRRFYREWYRPDLMAVVAVGTFDGEKMKEQIEAYFGDIAARTNPRERTAFDIPMREASHVHIFSDPEYTRIDIGISNMFPTLKGFTLGHRKAQISAEFISAMFSERMQQIIERPRSPFNEASLALLNFFNRTNVSFFSSNAVLREERIEEGIRAFARELQRVRVHGFTEGELSRVKKQRVKFILDGFRNAKSKRSPAYANEFVAHYLGDGNAMSPKQRFIHEKKLIKAITLEEVNGLVRSNINSDARIVDFASIEKEGLDLPTKEDILRYIAEEESRVPAPYVYEEVNDPLMAVLPTPGRIVSETPYVYDSKELVLSNGARVYLKKTDFDENLILFRSSGWGGLSLLAPRSKEIMELAVSDAILSKTGVGNHSARNLRSILSDKSVNLRFGANEILSGIRGRTTPEDLETFMQLLHLRYTAPRYDGDAFEAFKDELWSEVRNTNENPVQYFFTEALNTLAQNNPLAIPRVPTQEMIEALDLKSTLSVYKEALSNVAHHRFYFVGNYDEPTLRVFIEKYIASLPPSSDRSSYDESKIDRTLPLGNNKAFYKGEEDQSMILLGNYAEISHSIEQEAALNLLNAYINARLIKNLREKKSLVYGIFAQLNIERHRNMAGLLILTFCNPDNVDKIVSEVQEEFEKIQKGKIDEEELRNIKEQFTQDHRKALEENGFWLSALHDIHFNGSSTEEIDNYVDIIEKISKENLQEAFVALYKAEDSNIFTLYPENRK